MATNAQLIYYSNYSLEQLVDLINTHQQHVENLHNKLEEANETIMELQGKFDGE